MLCLDDDVFRKFARPKPDTNVVSYLSAHSTENWIVPTIVLFEYLQNFEAHNRIEKERQRIETTFDGVAPMDADVAAEAANIRARLATVGTGLDTPDLFIAAAARVQGATLATANENDFDKAPIHELLTIHIVPTSE